MAVTFGSIRELLAAPTIPAGTAFDLLASIGRHGAFNSRDEAREMLIRVLTRREHIPRSLRPMLNALVREHGLYPYLRDVVEMPFSDELALEMHRPLPIPQDDVVFHSQQAIVYERLLAGENVILSAPTSFGKSVVIDALLAARNFRNAAVVVPTIALMDECRRRLSRLRHKYKIITHGTQRREDRNLFVMTQERLLEVSDLPEFDFFAIDEFYKLDPTHSLDPGNSDERASQLNILFHRLLNSNAQFYLLGPSIAGLASGVSDALRATFIETGYTTVVTDVERINAGRSDLPDALADVCRSAGPQTLIFCRSPNRIREVARWLIDRGIGGGSDLRAAADWVGEAYHPDWLVARGIRRGVGIHHGRLPRALGHHIVRLFNERRLPYLLVTSTLIEGVNTTARTVVVLDNKIANKKYDYFTFSNIRGRSGRMSRYFVGRVIVFNPEPKRVGLNVDIPILTQRETASDEILINLPEEQLTAQSRQRLERYRTQSLVDIDTLRQNRGISLERQLRVAQILFDEMDRWLPALNWSGSYPTTPQVRDLAPLLFELTGSGPAATTALQLGARINMLRRSQGDLRRMIYERSDYDRDLDVAIDKILDFSRNWAHFRVPRAFTALNSIARDVLRKAGRRCSDMTVFAGQLENLFLPPFATVLEEYGVPVPLAVKLEDNLGLQRAQSLDDILVRLRSLRLRSFASTLGVFEREMLADAQQTL